MGTIPDEHGGVRVRTFERVKANHKCPPLRAEVDSFNLKESGVWKHFLGVKFYIDNKEVGRGYIETDYKLIREIEVEPEWQGKGCGSSILKFLEKKGGTLAKWDTDAGKALLERNGWKRSNVYVSSKHKE